MVGFQLVGSSKIERLVKLMDRAKIAVALDAIEAAGPLAEAMSAKGTVLDVYIEVDTGHHRTGVLAGEAARDFALAISRLPGLRPMAVMTHEGQASGAPVDEYTELALAAGAALVETAEMMREAGVPIEVVSVGSTVAAAITPSVPGVTEMRPGTYVFKDASAFRLGVYGPDRCAARIVATVANRPARDRAILDAGSKSRALDQIGSHPGFGYIVGHPEVILVGIYEEHGVVEVPRGESGFEIGDRVEIIPNHICPAVNLHDSMLIVRDGEIVDEWEIAARGRVR